MWTVYHPWPQCTTRKTPTPRSRVSYSFLVANKDNNCISSWIKPRQFLIYVKWKYGVYIQIEKRTLLLIKFFQRGFIYIFKITIAWRIIARNDHETSYIFLIKKCCLFNPYSMFFPFEKLGGREEWTTPLRMTLLLSILKISRF